MTHPCRERAAMAAAERAGYATYLPLLKRKIIKQGKRINKVEPLFPRYGFIHITDQWYSLLSTVGICKILMTESQLPAKIPNEIIDQLKAKEDRTGIIDISKQRFRHNQRVAVISGAFEGQVARFDRMQGPDRARVLLEVLGFAEIGEHCLIAA